MQAPISFWGYKEEESNLILPEHDDDKKKHYEILGFIWQQEYLKSQNHLIHVLKYW